MPNKKFHSGLLALLLLAPAALPGTDAKKYDGNAREQRLVLAAAPPDLQEGGRMFRVKCGMCHSLDRVFEKTGASQEEWADVVYRMQAMAASHLNGEQSKSIIRFVVWQSGQHPKPANAR